MIYLVRNCVKFTITFLLATGTLAFNAHAKSTFPNYIPNASVSTAQGPCTNCHRDPSGGDTLTLFGQDVYATLEGRRPDWSALYYLDSDGDGQTNGQELGDPCGTWVRGEPAPRETDISNPTDETLTSTDPGTPVCDDSDTTDASDPSDESDSTDASVPSGESDSTDASDPSDESDSTDASDSSGESDSTDASDPSGESDTTDASDTANTESGQSSADEGGCATTEPEMLWLLGAYLLRRRRKA